MCHGIAWHFQSQNTTKKTSKTIGRIIGQIQVEGIDWTGNHDASTFVQHAFQENGLTPAYPFRYSLQICMFIMTPVVNLSLEMQGKSQPHNRWITMKHEHGTVPESDSYHG